MKILCAIPIVLQSLASFAHPTGNLITVGDYVLWSYVNPINDPSHYACVMIWREGEKPYPWITSKFSGSDFMLYNKGHEEVYVIERRYVQSSDRFESRILKSNVPDIPKEIWPWFEDNFRVGEGGFYMTSDEEIVFARYPEIVSLKKNSTPVHHLEFPHPVRRIKEVSENYFLALADSECWLVNKSGVISRSWSGLLAEAAANPPLDRNQIFDVDYHSGQLLVANWGNRCFEIIDTNDQKIIISQEADGWTPHWVSFWGKKKLLFSSELTFDGSMPVPKLTLVGDSKTKIIWSGDL